jgi:hypothetical protein
MKQRLITIAVDYSPENEEAVASAMVAHFDATAKTIQEAVEIIVNNWQSVEGLHVPHWSNPETQNWKTQQEIITELHQSIDSHRCACCHGAVVGPVGVENFEHGACPPEHNCVACADTII